MKDKIYKEEFLKAAERTMAENYSLPNIFALMGKYKPYRTGDTYEALYRLFMTNFAEVDGTIDLSKVKGQCLNYHTAIADLMKKEFAVSPTLTIGYVNFLGKDFYKFEKMESSLVREIECSHLKVIDIHVWLTLPSFEIIDLTFLAHYAFLNSLPEKQQMLKKATDFPYFFGSAEFLFTQENIIFHPKYVGDDVLLKNGFARL
jgi:hypothetical protein